MGYNLEQISETTLGADTPRAVSNQRRDWLRMAASDITTFDSSVEEWRDVPGYEGFYQVSNYAHIRTLPHRDWRNRSHPGLSRKTKVNPGGYVLVTLSKNGKMRTHRVHSLVAAAFIGARPEGYEVNHLDGNKLNNCPSNLEYCTPSQNTKHAYDTGLAKRRFGEEAHGAKLTENDVRAIRRLARQGVLTRVISSQYSLSWTHVNDIIKRKLWRHVLDDA